MYIEKKIIQSPEYKRHFLNIIENADSAAIARSELQIQHDLDDIDSIDSEWNYHSPLSANVSVLLDSGSKIQTSINLLTQLKRRKRLKPVPDEAIDSCSLCQKEFSTFIRKHHCRACGQIFCDLCSNKRVELDTNKIVYSYNNYLTSKYRVCNICYDEIDIYNELKDCIELFRILGLALPLTYRCATLCRRWRQSIIYYLSDIRQIQYKLPTENLDAAEITFLKNNYKYIQNHSVWLLQYHKIKDESLRITLKSAPRDIPQRKESPYNSPNASPSNHYIVYGNQNKNNIERESGTISCNEMLCSRSCKATLSHLDAILFLAGGYQEDLAIKLLSSASIETIEILTPFLLYSKCDLIKDFLIEKARDNKNILRMMYWNLKVSKFNSEYSSILEKLLVSSADKDIIKQNQLVNVFLEYGKGEVDTLKEQLRKIRGPITNPLNGDTIIKIDVNNINIKNSHTQPILIPYWNDKQEYKHILYKNEDLRKDAYLMMVIRFISLLFSNEGIDLPIVTYSVMPISSNSGLIEIVENASTLYQILQESDLLSYLNSNNQHEQVGKLMERFRQSLAFWTIVTFIIGLGDRHIDNLMLLRNGTLFHIDFGYVFCKSPHVYDKSRIRLDDDMVRCLGGQTSYTEFKLQCHRLFTILRKYVMHIYSLMLVLCRCEPKIEDYNFSDDFFRNHINEVLMIGQTDEEVKNSIEKLIDNSRGSISVRLTDYFHGIFSFFKQQFL